MSVEALTDAIEAQDLWHGRHATSPAGSATARAILSYLRNHHGLELAVGRESAGTNWRADKTGVCPCGGQCHHGDRIEWCSKSCREAAHRTPAASGDVEAAWEALIIELDEPQPGMTSWGSIQRHRPRIEAAIRAEFSGSLAAALDEARAAVAKRCNEVLAAIDALREGAHKP